MEAVSEFLSSLYSYGILDKIVDYDHNSIEAVEFASIALPWKQIQRLRSRLSCPPPDSWSENELKMEKVTSKRISGQQTYVSYVVCTPSSELDLITFDRRTYQITRTESVVI